MEIPVRYRTGTCTDKNDRCRNVSRYRYRTIVTVPVPYDDISCLTRFLSTVLYRTVVESWVRFKINSWYRTVRYGAGTVVDKTCVRQNYFYRYIIFPFIIKTLERLFLQNVLTICWAILAFFFQKLFLIIVVFISVKNYTGSISVVYHRIIHRNNKT